MSSVAYILHVIVNLCTTHNNTHCNENPIYIFLFWEKRGLSPNFHIHVSVSDLYSPKIGLHISSSRIGRPIVGIYKSLTDAWMWKIGTVTPIFLFWEYLFWNFAILSLPCSMYRDIKLNTLEYNSKYCKCSVNTFSWKQYWEDIKY